MWDIKQRQLVSQFCMDGFLDHFTAVNLYITVIQVNTTGLQQPRRTLPELRIMPLRMYSYKNIFNIRSKVQYNKNFRKKSCSGTVVLKTIYKETSNNLCTKQKSKSRTGRIMQRNKHENK